jgi:hypothetical protein
VKLTDLLNERSFMGSPCTKDCSGHRAGYAWSKARGGKRAASWSQSFNNGAALAIKTPKKIKKAIKRKVDASTARSKLQQPIAPNKPNARK